MTNKPTDNEIIKALECCNENGDCSKCPYDRVRLDTNRDCASEMTADALDLIKRQKAENERLRMGEYRHNGKTVKNAYREGIEAVFDRLRNIISLHTENHISIGLKDIDLIELELVGEHIENT